MKKCLSVLLACIISFSIFSFQAIAETEGSENLLLGLPYTYTISSFMAGGEDNDAVLLTDGVYRDDADGVIYNGDFGVDGVSVELAEAYYQNVVQFAFDDAVSIGTVVIRNARAYFESNSLSRHCTVSAVKATNGIDYTDLSYSVEYVAVEGAPDYAIRQYGKEFPQYYDIIVTVQGAEDIKGIALSLSTERPDGSYAYVVQLDEIEAYAPGAEVPTRGRATEETSEEDFSYDMSSDDISSDSEDISTDAPTGEAVSYTVTITDNGDGTVTVVAAVPDGITSGKIVVSVSDKLSLVPDSISSDAVYGVAVNESYDRGGIMGACVSFASYSVLYEDTVAFKATYTVAEGAVIDASDITVPQWNLGLYGSVVADQDDRDVIKIFNSASSDDTSDDDIPYIASGTWGKLSWVIDAEYTLTVGGEGSMDNFDSASADAWLEYRDYIKAVVIEDGVTGIGSYAFADLGALASVTVGSGVITVGYNAFYNSNSLAVLYIKSPYTAATLTNGASNGYIALNAQTVAIDISISQVANYIKNNFTHIETFTYKQTGYTCYSKHQHDWEEHSIPALGCTVRGFEGYKCAVCGAINGNDVAIHTYSDVCDAVCNLCGEKRNSPHNYDKEWQYGNTDHWHECTLCGERKDIDPHYYESPCDTECHLCGAVRQAPHSYTELWEKDGEGHWLICEGCGDIAMADTHQYDDSCDDACNFCGTVREVTHSYMGCWTEEGRFYQCVQCGCKTAQMPEDYVLKLAPGADCTLKGGFVITQATLPTAQTVKEFFEAEVSVLDVNGNALAAEELVGTGCKAALCDSDGKVIDYVVIVISGDVDGDAKLTATDYIALEHSLKNPKNTVDCYTKACDITDDGLISTADLIALKIKLFY